MIKKDTVISVIDGVFSGFWWLLVVVPAVGISTWSLGWLAYKEGGLPIFLAAGVSACFDGGAIAAFYISLQWQRKYQSSGMSAQLAALLFAGSSFYLNWNHGVIMGYPPAVRYLLAMPSVVALITLELWLRYKHRAVFRPVPKPELMAWILFPRQSFANLRTAYRNRLEEQTGVVIPLASGQIDTELMRSWLRSQGIKVAFTGPISAEHRRLYARAHANGTEN